MVKNIVISKTSKDPIGDLIAAGWSYPGLAKEWDMRSESIVRKLRKFACVPRPALAAKMAVTLGWKSAGVVTDVWYDRISAGTEEPERLAAAGR